MFCWVLRSTSSAFGTPAPLESVTVPLRLAEPTCAQQAVVTPKNMALKAAMTCNLFDEFDDMKGTPDLIPFVCELDCDLRRTWRKDARTEARLQRVTPVQVTMHGCKLFLSIA
jgi:hypothetical protein